MMTRTCIGLVALVAAAGALACSSKPLDGPTTVQVHANRGWQPAGVRVTANQAFTIEYVAGSRDWGLGRPDPNSESEPRTPSPGLSEFPRRQSRW